MHSLYQPRSEELDVIPLSCKRAVSAIHSGAWLLCLVIACTLIVGRSHAASSTVVPISAELGTGIAGDLFPVTLNLSPGNVYLTEPVLQCLDPVRIAMQVHFQAYDHRPQQNIAISETGRAAISGRLSFDPGTRQVLLYDARLDTLQFDKKSAVTERMSADLKSAWSTQVTNPIRADLPPHPYLLPFRNNIQDLSYDGKSIKLTLVYE
jgi:hypothetical protein